MGLLDRFRRRVDLPPGVGERLAVQPGDRVLASAALDDGRTAAATRRRLVVADTRAVHADVAWHDVDSAAWSPEPGGLDVRLVTGSRLVLPLSGDTRTRLPEVVRERVQSSVVLGTKVEVRGRRGVRVVVRRTPSGLVTQTLPDAGIDLRDPAVADAVREARVELERNAGAERRG